MLKQVFTLLLLLIGPAFLKSQNAGLVWAKQIIGTQYQGANRIATDASGAAFTVGCFQGTADVDPGADTLLLFSPNGNLDGFIQKLNACGELEWVKHISGLNDDEVRSISIDRYGNIYLSGYFGNTVDFDPGPGVFNLTSAGGSDIFFMKLDPSGNFLWAQRMGGAGMDYDCTIKTDSACNIFLSGVFRQTVDFDPGPGSYTITSAGSYDGFVLKLDSTGAFLWASAFGGSNDEELWSIDIDSSGCVYTTGGYRGTMDCDPGAGVYNLSSVNSNMDVFVMKFDSTGNLLWAESIGGIFSDEAVVIRVHAGAVYISGLFCDNVDFDPGPGSYIVNSPGGYYSMFLLKLDCDGDFDWVKIVMGTDIVLAHGLEFDSNENIICGGYFQGTTDFDPGPAVSNAASMGDVDLFLLKLDSAGNFLWKKTIQSQEQDILTSLALTSTDEIYCTGIYGDTADFDPDTGVFNMAPLPFRNAVFVLKLGTVPEASQLDSLHLSPGAICSGDSTVLHINGNLNDATEWIVYADSCNGTFIAGNTTGYFSLSPASTTTYYVRGEGGCMNPGNCMAITLTVHPSYTISESRAVCSNGSYVFPDSTLQSNITGTVTHTSYLLSSHGCDSTIITTVEADSIPPVTYIQSPSWLCINWQAITLSSATPSPGVYSGTGVAGNTFDPALSGAGNFTVVYTYTDSLGCSDTAQQQVVVDLCTGILSAPGQEVTIAPSIFNEFTTVFLPENSAIPYTLSLYDYSGRKVREENVAGTTYRLERNDLPPGIYLCTIHDREGKLIGTTKIIAQ